MKFRIKQKILVLLVTLLSVTITSLALLAGYSTGRQNESAAFTDLDRDLRTWQQDLEHSVFHLRDVAIREVSDPASMALLAQLLGLQLTIGDSRQSAANSELSRTLGYEKSVALGRMLPVLRTGGFDSIALYLRGHLSHLVSTSRAGMMIARADHPGEVWISATGDIHGALPLQSWPAWQPDTPPPGFPLTVRSPTLPTVSFNFPTPDATAIEITIPIVGRTQDVPPDWGQTVDRFVSDLSIPNTSRTERLELAQPPLPLAVVVFRKLIERAALQEILQRTGEWATIFSPDATHNQHLAVSVPFSPGLPRLAGAQATLAPVFHRTVDTPSGSYYQALAFWEFDHRPRFILSLASSRAATLQNVRQTLTAILLVAGCILALSVAVGAFWVRRFIDPIVALTGAAKAIGRKSHTAGAANTTSTAELRPLDIQASDEVGDLAAAFNAMIAELRRSIETLEQRVQERTAEAMQLARARSDFLAQMSHELRTPLNAVLGYTQILQRDSHLDERQARGLAIIQESGQHLLTLINDILDFSRMEATKLELTPTEVVLARFLRGVTDIIQVKAEEKSLHFSFEGAPDLPPAVRVDEKRLRQILLNLLGNAIKFTDAGRVTLRVCELPPRGQSAHPSGAPHARLRFEVEDTGIGMSPEQQSRLFNPFEQLGDSKRREGGTGLGLAITNALVQLMRGKIGLSSEPGKGSHFWFELDLPCAEASVAVKPRRVATSYNGPRKKIVIADDVAESRSMLVEALASLGFIVFDAVNGRDAIERVQLVEPDLVLMDLMMPVMDGAEATQRIRQLPGFERLPVIVVSASAGPEEHSRSSAAGASGFLPKPIDHDLLLQTIGEQLSLQWSYRDEDEVPAAHEPERDSWLLPPGKELEQLYQAALAGSMREIQQLADDLGKLDPRYVVFATRLAELAKAYQSRALVQLLERCRSGASTATELESH
jgi:signal transduction histidine kinase/DNA-binding NarL/FixJ family response regulator